MKKTTNKKDASTTARQTAAQAYNERREDIARVIDWLQMELDKHAEKTAANPKNWGRAGDLSSILNDLVC